MDILMYLNLDGVLFGYLFMRRNNLSFDCQICVILVLC